MKGETKKMVRGIRGNPVLKVVFILVLVLLFLIPLTMIRRLVLERKDRSVAAEQEIMSLWGGAQTIAGPFIAVPYRKLVSFETDRGEKTEEVTAWFFLTPDTLEIEGDMTTEARKRGIYEVPVYHSDITVSGTFGRPVIDSLHIEGEGIYWKDAHLVVELPDMHALLPGTELLWNGREAELTSGAGVLGLYQGSLQSDLSAGGPEGIPGTFLLNLTLRGAGSLSFVPAGKETTVRLRSDWPAPSFDGAFLPSERELMDADGFTALWSVHSLARSFPGMWIQGEVDTWSILESSFGVNLFKPVDLYAMAERSVKYGILFILVPFLVFFLFEVFSSRSVHIMQYLMIGIANTVFYLLVLSVSEHLGFTQAYLLGASATTALVTFYAAAVLSAGKRGLLMAPVMAGLYVFLFTALQSEDYALLIGSIGLFVMTALVMVLTRRVNWYALTRRLPGE